MSPGLDELLLAALLSPEDLTARAVYADALSERGLLPSSRLSPELGRVLDPDTIFFRGGLLDACAFVAEPSMEVVAEPWWPAVRSLHRPPFEVVAQTRALEHLTGVDLSLLSALGHSRTPLASVQTLGLQLTSPAAFLPALFALQPMPRLSRLLLSVSGQGLNARHNQPDPVGAQCCEVCARPRPYETASALWPREMALLFEHPIGRSLTRLELQLGYADVGALVTDLEATRCDVAEVVVLGVDEGGVTPTWSLVLQRTAPGRYRRATMHRSKDRTERLDWEPILDTVPTHLDVELTWR